MRRKRGQMSEGLVFRQTSLCFSSPYEEQQEQGVKHIT